MDTKFRVPSLGLGVLLATILTCLPIVSLLGALPALGASPDAVRTAIEAGADRLLALQNADGGWFLIVGDTDCGLGPSVSCPNTFGVTALGLVNAYRVTHDPAHLAAAVSAANALVAKYAAAPPCAAGPMTESMETMKKAWKDASGTPEGRTARRGVPSTADLSFLAAISTVDPGGAAMAPEASGPMKESMETMKKAWKNASAAGFDCVMSDFPLAATRADDRIDGRIAQGLSNLGAWDASLDIRAAMDVGQRGYALAEAVQVIARSRDWDVADPDCPGCELLSKGLFIAATYDLQADPSVRASRDAWKNDLLSAQLTDGSWGGDTQVTAYAVMGLAATTQDRATTSAIEAALGYLLSRQQSDGGFTVGTGFTDEVTAVDGEVLQALAAAH
jgi:hypothetical protein